MLVLQKQINREATKSADEKGKFDIGISQFQEKKNTVTLDMRGDPLGPDRLGGWCSICLRY